MGIENNAAVQDAVERLKAHSAVHSVLLFGSYARGEADAESDIDLCIVTAPEQEVTTDDLVNLTTQVDAVIDIALFDRLPLNVRHRVLTEGEILFSRDEQYLYELLRAVSGEMPAYRRMIEQYHGQVVDRIEG